MEQRILVAYASKYGATAGIAERIGKELEGVGFAVDVQPADKVSDLTPYSAVVLGSAVYAGMWRKGAAKFLEDNVTALAEQPVWLFSSGPTGEGDPVELMDGWSFPENLQPVTDRIEPRDIAFFGGVLDMDKLNFAERMIVKSLKAPTGDFRDWDVIDAWAADIAAALQTA